MRRLSFLQKHNIYSINCSFQQACKGCKKIVLVIFKSNPFTLFISIFDKISFTDLPPTIKILDTTFNLLCISFASTSQSVQHFRAFITCKNPFMKSMIYLQISF